MDTSACCALVGTKQQRIGFEEESFADLSTVSSAAGLLGPGPEMPSRFVSGLPEWAGTWIILSKHSQIFG